MEKINQRVAVTKKMLKEGIIRLLQTKSINHISVTELCRESGINRTTFYTHYQTPHDVLEEMSEELLQYLNQEIQKKWTSNYQKNIENIAETICVFIYEHADLARIIIQNAADRTLTKMLSKTHLSMLKQYFVKDIDDESLRLIAAYLAGGNYFVLKLWLEEDMKKPPQEVAQLISKLFNDEIWQ